MSRAHRDARRGDGSSRYSPAQHRAKDTLEVLEFAGCLLAEAPTNLFAPLIDGAISCPASTYKTTSLTPRGFRLQGAQAGVSGTKSELVALLLTVWQQREG